MQGVAVGCCYRFTPCIVCSCYLFVGQFAGSQQGSVQIPETGQRPYASVQFVAKVVVFSDMCTLAMLAYIYNYNLGTLHELRDSERSAHPG